MLENKIPNAPMKTAKIVSKASNQLFKPDGITLCQNGGVFDELKHFFHLHIVPRYEGQSFALFYSDDGEVAVIGATNLSKTQGKFLEILS